RREHLRDQVITGTLFGGGDLDVRVGGVPDRHHVLDVRNPGPEGEFHRTVGFRFVIAAAADQGRAEHQRGGSGRPSFHVSSGGDQGGLHGCERSQFHSVLSGLSRVVTPIFTCLITGYAW